MAANSRAVIRAKRFLDRQAAGGKIGRFAVQRTLEHLKNCNVVLNENVAEVKINLAGPRHLYNGAQRFYQENCPQLKFKNPHVQFSKTLKHKSVGELFITFADGQVEKMVTTEKDASEIMEEFVKLANKVTTSNNESQDIGT